MGGGSGFGLDVIEAAFRSAGQPAWERIKHLCQGAESEMESDREHADRPTRRLIAEGGRALAILDRALPAKHRLREAAHDEVALMVLRCQVGYASRTEDWDTSLELLQRALQLARSASARDWIQENIEIVRENAKALRCWFCEANRLHPNAAVGVPMHGNVRRVAVNYGHQLRWDYHTVQVPRCIRCRSIHRRREAWTLLGGLAGGVLGAGADAAVTHLTGA